jgi:hypothetical protein
MSRQSYSMQTLPSVSSTCRKCSDRFEGNVKKTSIVKLSHYSSYRRQGGEEYSSYSFLTSTLYGGEWSVSRPGRALPPEKDLLCPLDRRPGGLQSWSGYRSYRKKSLASAWNRTTVMICSERNMAPNCLFHTSAFQNYNKVY